MNKRRKYLIKLLRVVLLMDYDFNNSTLVNSLFIFIVFEESLSVCLLTYVMI